MLHSASTAAGFSQPEKGAAKRERRTSAVSILYCWTSKAYVSIRQHTSEYVSIRQHTSAVSILYFCTSKASKLSTSKRCREKRRRRFVSEAQFDCTQLAVSLKGLVGGNARSRRGRVCTCVRSAAMRRLLRSCQRFTSTTGQILTVTVRMCRAVLVKQVRVYSNEREGRTNAPGFSGAQTPSRRLAAAEEREI